MPREILDKKTWIGLRPKLNNSYSYNQTWGKVISLFERRIMDFYFNPIDLILAPQSRKGEGFAILTLQCALIEMFSAFKTGMIYNKNKPKNGGLSYEYISSHKCFTDFLLSEEIFKDHFFTVSTNGVKKPNDPYNASQFYERVRCGLMHEAHTKNDWRITANPQKTSNDFFIGIILVVKIRLSIEQNLI